MQETTDMKALLPIYVTVTTFFHDRLARVRRRAEHGQGALEYLGLVVIIAIALVIAINGAREPLQNLANNFVTQVRSVLGATGGGG